MPRILNNGPIFRDFRVVGFGIILPEAKRSWRISCVIGARSSDYSVAPLALPLHQACFVKQAGERQPERK